MADEKKEVVVDPFVEFVWTILTIIVYALLLNQLYLFLVGLFSGVQSTNPILAKIQAFLRSLAFLIPYLEFISVAICFGCIIWIMYLSKRIAELRENERALLYPEIEEEIKDVNPAWQRIITHVESLNENDWRLAIIEADIMLAGLLEKMSLPGDTIGEKLKAVEKSDFTTIDNAWEAHKIRNQIAHDGPAFLLNQREARRVIELFRTVFEEFQII